MLGDVVGETGTGVKMDSVDKINQLIELNEHRNILAKDKREAAWNQKYEEAAAFRDKERRVLNKINEIVKIEIKDFVSKDIYYQVEKDFYAILDFIEKGDTNLTPALLRKLSQDANIAKANEESLKERLKEEVKKFEWISTRQERPTLVQELKEDQREWNESDEVLILYVKDDGKHGICIAKYTEEWAAYNEKICTFQVSEDVRDSFTISNPMDKAPKGWKDIPGLKVKGWMNLPEKKITRR
jgi:hypothetical protein